MTTKTASKRHATPRYTRRESREQIIEAATALLAERSFAELSVGEIMERAGRERTIFYRNFDGLTDMLLQASAEAVGGTTNWSGDLKLRPTR